jgi:NTE family protein
MAGKLAVVLSGGGAKGAFQVGVLDELITRRRVKVDIAVGTSTGAIQAAAVVQDDLPRLLRLWQGIEGPSDIYKKRGGLLLNALTGKDGLFETRPLKDLLKANIDEAKIRASGKTLRIALVNLTTGALTMVDERSHNLADFVYASCAMPFAFDPLTTSDGTQWADGGVRDVTPLDPALELAPRAVIVIRASAGPKPGEARKYRNLVEIGLRAVDILQSEVSLNDLKNVNLINRLINVRDQQMVELARAGVTGEAARRVMRQFDLTIAEYRLARVEVIAPTEDHYDTLDFVPAEIDAAIQRGRDALNAAWPRIEPLVAG